MSTKRRDILRDKNLGEAPVLIHVHNAGGHPTVLRNQKTRPGMQMYHNEHMLTLRAEATRAFDTAMPPCLLCEAYSFPQPCAPPTPLSHEARRLRCL